eukprot:gene6767-9145_t
MGMPITIEVVGATDQALHDRAFAYLEAVDHRFSTYRSDSEISAINRGEIARDDYSPDMREVFALAEQTYAQSDGSRVPSGIVKGWAIRNTANLLSEAGARNFFVDAGGDVQSAGRNAEGEEWRAGIQDPFHPMQFVKLVYPRGRGIATSGTYVRGHHIYDPHHPDMLIDDVVSLTVIGQDVLEAARFATAAFAMGSDGINFIETLPGLEGYQIDRAGI